MKELKLVTGEIALVDDDDFALVSRWKWRGKKNPRTGTVYACRSVRTERGMRHIYLHNVLMGPSDGREVDHRDGNSLNCQRSNMRRATHLQNLWNRKVARHNKSGLKGVRASGKRWRATITLDGHPIHLGCFDSAAEAARAYDDAARTHFGEFARVNFPAEGEQAA